MIVETATIPGPPGLPFVGNISDIDAENTMLSLCNLTDTYEQVRNGVHDGLFTARGPQEENWGVAHRVLLPQLGPLAIRNMFPEMHDIASQLVTKWARHGPNHRIQVSEDFTRMTLDTIGLCEMDYRFNSYYSESMHPFVEAMADFLKISGDRSCRDAVTQMFYRTESQKYQEDIALLRKTSFDVINERKKNPTDRKDLLNGMLKGVDPKTGKTMTDESVVDNLIAFLIAGHETTSALLSFTWYCLLKNAAAYEVAQQEVDTVIGNGPITIDYLTKLPYLNAILRETLPLRPNAPTMALAAKEDTFIGGKYPVKANIPLLTLFPKIHRDPVRMLEEEFTRREKEFPNSWKPIGNGMRACIGRPFAWQEALLVMAMLLQNFHFSLDDPSYQLHIKQTLSIKPKDFYMRARLRSGVSATALERTLASATLNDPPANGAQQICKKAPAKGKPMSIYYGSNNGTCEALANRLASDASNHGFRADVVDALDFAKADLPTDRPIAIITASYEGQPADNATQFVQWIGTELKGVSYAVFGCGHRDWAKTFQKVPKYLNQELEKAGATCLVDMGSADAAQGDIFTEFETWEDRVFWPAVKEKYGSAEVEGEGLLEATLGVEISTPQSSTLRQDVREARVEDVQVLRRLPRNPWNPKENIQRAMRHFGLSWESMLTISSTGPTTLPADQPISAIDVFGAYIELAQPASRRNVHALADATRDEATQKELTRLAEDAFGHEITSKRVSVLDLLERFPSVQLPLGIFLKMQPPMRVRQYSISSSPLWNPNNATLTYAVVDQPVLSGQGRFVGVATNYLSNLAAGDKLHVSVWSSHQAFHLPKDLKNVPVIMIAAGTELAAGRELAPALLFYGCHSPDSDLLYSDPLKCWKQLGAVSSRYAFSRASDQSEGCKYVQDRLYHDRQEIVDLFEAGSKLFVCGSRDVGDGAQETLIKIAKETKMKKEGIEVDDQTAREWFEGLRNERFATDVFA
ncbi:cytochrome P450 [Didymella exigua CBS 183.55]|uniref:Cytochrome P450 n=1 Tax=Didymella exigua CBS 183.55 TaxID=1150837 RepID=A0A6A5RTC7_9PLEO|nr:cytochrome P450 [Didymella exigua CBS 183.55]KAF1930650.1 cytochrome P450 [Didymella exigua CBS 183.55]